MKIKFLLIASFCFSWIVYSGFSNDDESPKWSKDPRTLISLNPDGQYIDLPRGTDQNYSNETRYIPTPEGVFAVGPNFRVHPTASRTQSETPITRHPQNPNIMFASANTYNVGGTTSFSVGHYVTTNGGLTFFGDDTTNFNFGDPAPMVMHTGRLLISYITGTGSMGAAYSVNNGSTWSGTVTFPGATNSADKNLSCVDGEPTSPYYGRCYTVYTEFGGAYSGRIVATWSSNGGVTWSSVLPVSPVPSAGHHHQGCDVTVDIFGWVRVAYANCTTNGQNSTEDYLGWAESGTGGTSWSDMSDTKVNMNGIRTSDLLTPSNVTIRANGFPRIDGDRTCLPTAGDAYVVAAEKNFAPALDNADIVLMKTENGGSTWSRIRVNQNAAGSYEWFPAVNVDATGAINVCYYSTRGIPTNDSARIYLSRSTNGGTTWVDVLVSDHKFKPVPISGLATGYQGDYIGITSGGAGKIIPYWCEQSPTSGGRYQAWAALVDVSITAPCEDFSCPKDTGSAALPIITRNFYEEYSGTNYWSRRAAASAYAAGTGSARFNAWSASGGTVQSLVSYNFANAGANTYLTFDQAYASWSGGPNNIDSLNIQYSVNGGATFSILQRLYGGANGNMNTVPPGGQLTPTGGQWRPRIFLLPVGTNKIKIRGYSGFGGDIWIDNVCVQTLPAPAANSIGLAHQGMFKPENPFWNLLDTIRVYLHRSDFPNVAVDSTVTTMGSNAVSNALLFNRALTGNFYRVVKHRNSIETWSNVGVAYTRGLSSHHNFIQPSGQAYANNQAIVSTTPLYRGIYAGDVDRDHAVDIADVSQIENAAFNFIGGYVVWDLTGDNFVDLNDQSIADNNSFNFVVRIRPPGAEPAPAPFVEPDAGSLAFENEEQRQKHELTVKLMYENKLKENIENSKAEINKELQERMRNRMNRKQEDASPTNENLQKMIYEQKSSNQNGKLAGELY